MKTELKIKQRKMTMTANEMTAWHAFNRMKQLRKT